MAIGAIDVFGARREATAGVDYKLHLKSSSTVSPRWARFAPSPGFAR
jgi:hypothetical protein